MTPAERYDLIVLSLVEAADHFQAHRDLGAIVGDEDWLRGQDNLAVAEYHSQQLQKECPKINLHETIDFDQLL